MALPGGGLPARRYGAWWPLLSSANATQKAPTGFSSASQPSGQVYAVLAQCSVAALYPGRVACGGHAGAHPTQTRQARAQAPTSAPPPADLHSAQVGKRRQSGRVGEVTTKISFGLAAAVPARLAASVVRQTIHTSCVARHHLTCRPCKGRLARQVLSFAKALPW
jgi:hypothetical protein